MLALEFEFRKSAIDGEIYFKIGKDNTIFTAYGMDRTNENEINRAFRLLDFVNSERLVATPISSPTKRKPEKLGSVHLKLLLDDLIRNCELKNMYYEVGYSTYYVIVSVNFPKTYGGAVAYSTADITYFIQTRAPSDFKIEMPPEVKPGQKMYRCQHCTAAFSTKASITQTPTSLGKKIGLCISCKHLIECGLCHFNEPRGLIKNSVHIATETGKNKKIYACKKCQTSLTPCRNCGLYYDSKLYPNCPCRLPLDFKPYIGAHNADVLKYCQKDAYNNELFGMELETGTLNQNRAKFKEIVDATHEIIDKNAILKYDSSIDYINKNDGVENRYKGFEVVARPMIYKNTLRFIRTLCKNRHPLLRSWEVGTCGLHIHVGKAGLRPIEIGKILLFVNDKRNRPFIKMIAKREDKRFAKFLTKKILDYKNNTPGANGVPVEHYEAVNTSKPYTIEFRIFRGTLNTQTVVSYLQFVKSLIDFIKVTPQNNLLYTDYTKFLFSTERSQFRELKKRIESESLKRVEETGEI